MKTEILYGFHAVKEALSAGRRELLELYVDRGHTDSTRLKALLNMAEARGVAVRTLGAAQLALMAGCAAHQAVALRASPYPLVDLARVMDAVESLASAPVLVLDCIMDPHNLGAIVRSAHALGAHGVVMPRDRAAGVTPSAAKASAGAVEHMAIARVTNLVRCIEGLREFGIWTVATVPDGDVALSSVDLRGPIALVLGGEGQGIRPLVRKSCDHAARIPMLGKVGSLNASAAAAIALYEATRQRGESTGKIRP